MNRTFKKVSLLSLAGLASLGILSASAMGFGGGMGMGSKLTADELATRHTEMFAQHASILGLSVAEVKTAWAQGKNMLTLAKEKGISQTDLQAKMQALRQAEMKEHLSTLVSKGVITQAQADQRLTYMKSNVGTGKNANKGQRGTGRGMMGF
ncbi:MAG: hypothetical protein QG653_455 [Patescibacteria group bacterium]|nr:hypothetical protein [Patescibacteria group bacterium]